MTVDKARLKAHAESLEAKDAEGRGETKHAMYITATDMLEMLAEIERLEGQVRLSKTAIEMAVQGVVGRGLNDYIAVSMERDQLKADNAGLKTGYEAYERVNAELRAECEKLRKDAMPLELVSGDQLPPVGSTVLIHLGRSDAWVEHTVVGYYAWCDLTGNKNLHRVFVRVRDADGYLNARLLRDVRAQSAMSKEQSHD